MPDELTFEPARLRLVQTAEELFAMVKPSPCDPDLIRRRYEEGLARQKAQEAEYARGPLNDEGRLDLAELQEIQAAGEIAYEQHRRLSALEVRESEELRETRIRAELAGDDGWAAAAKQLHLHRVRVTAYRSARRVDRGLLVRRQPRTDRRPARGASARRARARAPARPSDRPRRPSELAALRRRP